MLIPHCLDHCLCGCLKNQCKNVCMFSLLFPDSFGNSRSFCILVEIFRISLSISTFKKLAGLYGIVFNLYVHFGENGGLNSIIFKSVNMVYFPLICIFNFSAIFF